MKGLKLIHISKRGRCCYLHLNYYTTTGTFTLLAYPEGPVLIYHVNPIRKAKQNNRYISCSIHMMTSSNGNIFRVTGPLCGEFPAQRPVPRSFDVFFDLHLNKMLSKQLRGWWFETSSHPLWRPCNELTVCSHYSTSFLFTVTNHRSITPKFVTPTALSCIDNSWRTTIIYTRWSSRR